MRLVISLIPQKKKKNKIAFWNGRQPCSGSIDFGSPQFIFINCKLGFGAWKEDTPSCVCTLSVLPRVERGCVSLFKQRTLTIIPKNRVKKKKSPTPTKPGRRRSMSNLHDTTLPKVLMMNFKSDEVWVQVEQSRVATTAFEPDTCGRMNRRGKNTAALLTLQTEPLCQCGKSTNGTNHLTLVWQNSC